MNWLIARLKEPSSWRGIVWLLTFAGIALEPEQKEAIITVGIAIAGALGVFTRDSSAADSQNQRTELPPIELQSPRLDRRLVDSDPDLADRRRVVSGAGDGEHGAPEWVQSPVPTPSERVARLEKHDFTSGWNDQ